MPEMKAEAPRADGLIAIPLGKQCVLLLTQKEYETGIRRGKAVRRRESLAKRTSQPKKARRHS